MVAENSPVSLVFKHQWRTEQRRVLAQIQHYLDDDRIHLVAAPGAGKTVIGLEIFNQLQLKTLIVSPTRLIRDQWIERLTDFKQQSAHEHWFSDEVEDLKFLTSTTYQALFSLDIALQQKQQGKTHDDSCIGQWIVKQGVELLILDEAHHLKAAWQQVLMKIIAAHPQIKVISLTATPPIDASAAGWSRYQQLCGPIDEQISIPELVKSGSLCPHQDYIWMINSDEKHKQALEKHQQQVSLFIESLLVHDELLYMFSLHHWLNDDLELDSKDVLLYLDECIALLSLLKVTQQRLPLNLLQLLSIKDSEIESMTMIQWQVLLQAFLDGEHFPQATVIETFRSTLQRLLRSKGFLSRQKVNFDRKDLLLKGLQKSKQRIKACFDIMLIEHQSRNDWMRLLILADFIRDEKLELDISGHEVACGAYPIFHYFIHHCNEQMAKKTVLLTGRLVMVHQQLLKAINDALGEAEKLLYELWSVNHNYVLINNATSLLSPILTQLHKNGQILIIIGTRSLLGEGWDAPHVNALVMATQVSSYVSTNQLRGRAIRIDPDDDLKTASIWHIVALAQHQHYDGDVLFDLQRRFSTFAGIHTQDLLIESGLDRLTIDSKKLAEAGAIKKANEITVTRFNDDIFNLSARWQNALDQTSHQQLQHGLEVQWSQTSQRNNLKKYIFHANRNQKKRFKRFVLSMLINVCTIPLWLQWITSWQALMLASFGAQFLVFHYLYSSKKLKIRSSSLEYAKGIAQVVLLSLQKINKISVSINVDDIVISEIEPNIFRFSVPDLNRRQNDIFLQALSQALSPIDRSRYLVVLDGKDESSPVFSVPHIFAVNKQKAGIFFHQWCQHMPTFNNSLLCASHSEKGRRLLLKNKAVTRRYSQDITMHFKDKWI